MIEIIQGFPPYVTAFRATGKVTSEDYHNVINPMVKSVAYSQGKVNYLLLLETPIKNYSIGAWMEDALLGFRYFRKWNKLAIVTKKNSIRNFTNSFGFLVPCPTKGYSFEDIDEAKEWIAEL